MPDNPNPRRITEAEYQRRFHKDDPPRDRVLDFAVVLFVGFAAFAAAWWWL